VGKYNLSAADGGELRLRPNFKRLPTDGGWVGFYLPPLLGRFRRSLGGCCDWAEDTLASGNYES
jgi:hypothetical protein